MGCRNLAIRQPGDLALDRIWSGRPVALRPPLAKGLPFSAPRYAVVRRSLPAGSHIDLAHSWATNLHNALLALALQFSQNFFS